MQKVGLLRVLFQDRAEEIRGRRKVFAGLGMATGEVVAAQRPARFQAVFAGLRRQRGEN